MLVRLVQIQQEAINPPLAAISSSLKVIFYTSIFQRLSERKSAIFDAGSFAAEASYRVLYLYVGIFVFAGYEFRRDSAVLARLISGRRSSTRPRPARPGTTVTDAAAFPRCATTSSLLLFLIFDVEAIAILGRHLPGSRRLRRVVIFVSILAVGLIYAWKKGPQMGVMQQFSRPNMITTSTDKLSSWAHKNSLAAAQFGVAWLRHRRDDVTNGPQRPRPSAPAGLAAAGHDVMIVSGHHLDQMAERMTRLYEQMPGPSGS